MPCFIRIQDSMRGLGYVPSVDDVFRVQEIIEEKTGLHASDALDLSIISNEQFKEIIKNVMKKKTKKKKSKKLVVATT